MPHLDAYKESASASPFFPIEDDKMPSKKYHILMSAVMFPINGLWMQYMYLNLTKNWACRWWFRRKYCTVKDGIQTYYFIADKSCLLFTIILKVLSGWEVIKTQGKCIKSYKIFWKDFCGWAKPHLSEGQLLKLFQALGFQTPWITIFRFHAQRSWETNFLVPWKFMGTHFYFF